jgi:predicted nucleic acid-binding Zn ribbon protein
MHPDLLQELNEFHIQDLHRGVARTRYTHPLKSIRRFRARAAASPATLAKNAREFGSHA